MKNTIYVLIALFMAGCSSIKVTSDYDKEADFTKYSTFMYYGWSENSDKILNDFDKKRIEEAFKDEFSKRGWNLTQSDADATVSLFIVVDQKTSYTSYTNHYGGGMYGGMYGPRYGYGMGGMSTTTTQRNDYLEGTLIVDVFDTEEKKHIWQGIGKKTINEDSKDREGDIRYAVSAIMKQFPIKPIATK
ncbi:MAG: DUF4136 domain-containing protein [Cyclobacteriaceae bacterium]